MTEFTPFSFFLADRARNLILSPWHPHRRLTERPEPVAAYHSRLGNLYAHSLYGDHKAIGSLVADISGSAAVVGTRRTSTAVIHTFVDVLAGFVEQNKLHWSFLFPKLDLARANDTVYALGLRRELDDLEPLLVHETAIRAVFKNITTALLRGFSEYVIPDSAFASERGEEPTSPFAVPLIDLVDEPRQLVRAVMMTLMGDDDHNHDPITYRTFNVTRTQLFNNLVATSGLTWEQANKNPHKAILPEDSSLTSVALAEAYLKKTPFLDLLTMPVPLIIPRDLYTEHTIIFAPSGHGKTQLLQNIIYGFLQEPDPPALFIVDSQGDMLRKINALDFNHRGRLVILDPEANPPPQLNFLDFSGTNQAGIDELFGYLMSALSRDLTAKQGTAAGYVLRLMRAIPGATIDTLRHVMESKTTHPAIANLDPLTQDFFKNQFNGSEMKGTRQQVASRLYTLLLNTTFKAMFAAPKNTFDAFKCMQEKKIVLINTSQRTLREASSVLGRYFIAQCLAAAYERAEIDEEDRHLALLIVDEAKQYFDDYTDTILEQSRKYGLGLIAATQYVEQMPESTKAAVAGNTAVKYAGPVSQKDARFLAPEMYTTPEFIRSMKKHSKIGPTEFAVHVRGLTSHAVRLTVPFGTIENAARYEPTAIDRPSADTRSASLTSTDTIADTEPTLPDEDPYKATKLT